jgi:type II secretory pathway pseudopilin PulG
VELLVVVVIIAILMSMLFPAIRFANEGGRKSKASTEIRQITTAVQAFYTEYGRYPFVEENRRPIDVAVGDAGIGLKIPNRELFYTLRAMDRGVNTDAAVNPRRVAYFQGNNASDPDHPHGFLTQSSKGSSEEMDCFFDPWGRQYCVAIDFSYDGRLKLAYADFAGENAPAAGVGAFSLGLDNSLGASGNQCYLRGDKLSDDVISWK